MLDVAIKSCQGSTRYAAPKLARAEYGVEQKRERLCCRRRCSGIDHGGTRVDEHAVRAVRTCHDQLDLLELSKKDTDAVIGSPPIDRRPLTAEHEIPPRSQG